MVIKSIYTYSTAFDLYIGEKRSGKDISIMDHTYQIVKNFPEIKIYSNFWLNPLYYKNVQYIKPADIERYYREKTEFKNSLFLFSEMHNFFDSRLFSSKVNILFSYFVGQVGKRKNIIKGNTHFPEMLDVRLRAYCERYIYCYKGLELENGIFDQMKNYNEELTPEENEKLRIKRVYITRKLHGFQFLEEVEKVDYVKAKNFFDHYNTDEVIFKELEE